MKIKFGILLFSGFICICFVQGQEEICYQPKSLLKELQKDGIETISQLSEIIIPDSIINSYELNGKYFQVNKNPINNYRFIYVGRVNSCRAGGCSRLSNIPAGGEPEYFDYYILFDPDKTVRVVSVFNYQATHGQEITARGWLRQFIGHSVSESLQVNKNIDAISGATISVYAITQDVESKTKLLTKLRE